MMGNAIPKVGEIWVNIKIYLDDHIQPGGKVMIVSATEDRVKWDYIPHCETECDGYGNGWSLESFLAHYRLDEIHQVEQLLKEYDDRNT
jgi:hypothetical protein